MRYFSKKMNFKKIHFIHYCQSRTNSNYVPLSYFKIATKYDLDGTKKNPLLSFHGLFGNKNNLKSLMKQINLRTGQVAYSFDLRNHGESPHVDGYQSDLNSMAYDIKFFIEQNHMGKIDLLGHSLGGRVVSQFAFNWPEKVDKLILVDITPLPLIPKLELLTILEVLDSSIRDLPENINLSQARIQIKNVLYQTIKNDLIVDFLILNLYQDTDGNIKWRLNIRALEIMIKKNLFNKINISRPFMGKSLIIYGEQSDYVRPDQFDEIRSFMPNIKFIPIADTDHYLHVKKANQFLDHVVEFLNE